MISEQAEGEADHVDRMLDDHPQVDAHAHRDEEEAHEQPLEGRDRAFQLMTEVRVRQQHAGHERAERHRQAAGLHQQRETERGRQRGGGEHLPTVDAADMAKDAIEHRPAYDDHNGEQHQADHRRHAVFGPFRAEQRKQREQRNDHQVLEQQDGERLAAVAAVQFVALGQRRQHERGRGKRKREPGKDGFGPTQPEQLGGTDEQAADAEELQCAQTEHRLPERPQATGLELEADDEQQQHDAQLRGMEQVLRIVHEPCAPGSDQHAGNEIAQHRAESGPLEEGHEQHGDGKQGGKGSDRLHAGCLAEDSESARRTGQVPIMNR